MACVPKTNAGATNQIAELSWLTITNHASELESSGAPLSHNLVEYPIGATVSTNGVITWMPTEAQGPCISQILAVVTDGTNSVTNSFTVIVTEENERPVAFNDSYTVSNATLTVLAPGVLGNDTDVDLPANDLTVELLSGPTNGVLNLSSNGGFVYTPNSGFSGTDGFAYRVHDALTNSASATVTLTVLQQGFRILSVTKTGGVAKVTWESETGKSYRVLSKDGVVAPNWRVLVGDVVGTTATTNKTDSVGDATQRFYRVQMLTNRAPELPNHEQQTIPEHATLTVVNTATDVDLPNELFTYALTEAPTNAVISTNGVITWTPTESQGPGTNIFTTIVTDNGGLTATNSFSVIVTETNEPPVFAGTPTDLVVAEHTPVTVTNFATDVDEPANTLIYNLIDAPAGATVDGNGVFTWTPSDAQGPSTNTLTTVVSDGVASVTNSFVVVVTDVNESPTLPTLPNVTIAELEALTVTNTATDLDVPANTLTYNLVEFPAGALLNPNGVITWTPGEAQGDTTNVFVTIVTDDLGLSATNSFVVVVTEANVAPQFQPQLDVVIAELASLTVTNAATDADIPVQGLSYQLINPPSGAVIDASGVISWTPIEAQGPATNLFVTVVTDGSASATNSFTVTVTEENVAPILPAQSNLTIAEISSLVVTNTATDSDEPANVLTYNLVGAPTGALVDTNGVITWTPTEAQGATTNEFTTVVTDEGGLSATNHFTVTVAEVNQAPQLPTQPGFVVAEHTLLTVTNAATDLDEPVNGLTYSLTTFPIGAAVDTNGVITWTPNESQGPSTNAFVMVVSDDSGLSATNGFTVVVTEANAAPQLAPKTNVSIAELATLTVTNSASDSDEPVNHITYHLEGPTSATIDTNGVITWTPTEAQGPSTNVFTTVATDSGGMSATNSFSVVVTEVNVAPGLPSQSGVVVAEHTLLTVTNLATDPDEPANLLTYTLLQPPSGAVVNTNGVITWTPEEAQGPGTNVITTVVTDSGGLSATNSFTVIVTEVNAAPSLPTQNQKTIAELSALTVTNTATDSDLPANLLTYSLLVAPTNAVISTNGVITWTPNESQGPATNTFMTVVTDGGLSATNSFIVVATEVNTPPSLPAQSQRNIAELTQLIVTNAASDVDLPANLLAYSLLAAPTNAVISTDGVITWTPTETQGPGTNTLTTVVTDSGGLSATNSFVVVVSEVNVPPTLPAQIQQTIAELSLLTVTNAATDSDIPANLLTYSLLVAPTNAVMSTNGVITWTPNEAQGPSTNTFTTVVSDGGLSATNNFIVVVTEVNVPPALLAQTQKTIAELSLLSVTNTATDSDFPANALAYTLSVAPTNAVIATNGIITWTPNEAQGPSTNTFTTIVTDSGGLSATNTFTVVVTEVNLAPVANNDAYPVIGPLSINAPGILANDTDADLPANTLTAVFVSGPTNGNLNLTNNGGFTYSPNPGFSGADAFTYRVNDGTSNSASATVTFTVTSAPYITGQPNNQTVVVGSNTSFFVAAAGTAPMNYQWRKGGVIVPGGTSSQLSLVNVQTNDAGSYQAVITNAYGAVTSAVATLTVNIPGPACLAAPSGMIGWWAGDGNANDIYAGQHGTLVGGATANGVGKVSLAFTFDGTNNYVSIPDSPTLRPTNFTIEAWVKFDNLNSAGSATVGQQYIVFKQNTRASQFEGFFLGKERNGGNDTFTFGVTPASGPGASVNSTTLVATGIWYHVAAVRSATTIQLFVNGVMQASDSANFAQDYGNFPLFFGSSGNATWDRKFKGVLDEVTIYNRALASNEVVAIYAANAGGKCKGPAAPAIITQPSNKTYVPGGSTSFSVVAAGSEPLSYQWYRDGFVVVNDARVSGANSAVLSLTAMQPSDIGNYNVTVSNAMGTATSAIASLNTGTPPPNDNFASAYTISGNSGSTNGNNANATRQAGEPNHAGNAGPSSVWYNWTAPSSSPVTFDTSLSSFDTLLGVYTGSSVSGLTQIAANNNISTNNGRSRVTFTPVSGTVYRIAVDGDDGANGNLTLRWVQANVALPDLVIFNSAVNPHVVTESFAANSCAVQEGLVPAGTRRIIRFDTQTANQGNADLIFGDPSVNPAFVFAPCHAHYHFQNYMSYRLRDGSGQIAATGLKVGFCVLDVFRWDNGAPNNAKYDCNNQGIQRGWGDLYDSTLDGQWIDITGLPDGNYFIEMEVNPVGIILESNYGNNITTIPITVGNSSAPPLNNNFSSAQTLLGTSPSVAGANLNATKESGEPNHAGNAGGKSIWYNWTAPSTKAVTIDTINSGFNTLLAVYTGNAVNSLTLVTNNDDIIPGSVLQSRVTFNAISGTQYRIAVDGFGGASSNVIITVNQTVANDAYNACIFVGGVLGSISGSTAGATKEVGEPSHAGNAGGHSTWYCWTAPVSGTVTFDTEGSTFNTLLGVYTGSSVSALTFIAGNDNDGTNQYSRVSFNAVGLTMYHIVIDGNNGDSGNTMLGWSLSAAAPSSAALIASLSGDPNAGQMPTDGRAILGFNLLAEGMCQVTITGQPQTRYRVERSCDLRTWVPLVTTVADFNGKAYFTDKAARHLKTGSSDAICGSGQILGVAVSPTEARFYRAVPVP